MDVRMAGREAGDEEVGRGWGDARRGVRRDGKMEAVDGGGCWVDVVQG